jgi:hypothetical protein
VQRLGDAHGHTTTASLTVITTAHAATSPEGICDPGDGTVTSLVGRTCILAIEFESDNIKFKIIFDKR